MCWDDHRCHDRVFCPSENNLKVRQMTQSQLRQNKNIQEQISQDVYNLRSEKNIYRVGENFKNPNIRRIYFPHMAQET